MNDDQPQLPEDDTDDDDLTTPEVEPEQEPVEPDSDPVPDEIDKPDPSQPAHEVGS